MTDTSPHTIDLDVALDEEIARAARRAGLADVAAALQAAVDNEEDSTEEREAAIAAIIQWREARYEDDE